MTPALDHIAPGEELKNTALTQLLWIGARKLPVRAVTEVTPNRTFCLFGTFSVTFSVQQTELERKTRPGWQKASWQKG